MPLLGIDLRRTSQIISPSVPPLQRSASLQSTPSDVSAVDLKPKPARTKSRGSMDHIKRPTIPGLGKRLSPQDKDKAKSHVRSQSKDKLGKKDGKAVAAPAAKPIVLNLAVESPPALLLDSPQTSSGYLLSGRLQVTPVDKDVIIDRIAMFLEATITTKKPVAERCRECSTQVKDLYEWKFFTQPKTFKHALGRQELPFSHLIPGHLPASTHGQIGSVSYSLHVRAYANDGVETEFWQGLNLKRALRPGNDKNSIRVFPPTNLNLLVTLPSVIHPIGAFPVQCRMTGITTKKEDIQTRWRLRKLQWRIEENEEMISPACSQHAAKVGGEGKGIQNQHTRAVGTDDIRGPFKTDLDDGMVEGEFEASMDASTHPQCDVESANGLKISHSLVLELVIAEEWAPNRKPQSATPTGSARVLRTQFKLIVTERMGMGISWDDEQPPTYEDVPASPPHYANESTIIEDYEGEDLHGDIEQLRI